MDYQLGPGPLQVDQNTTDEKIKGDIGIVENGDIATHAILKDYYVIWKGNLYKAKTDISSGTTLSAESNGNLDPKSNGLGGEVAALNSKIAKKVNNKTDFIFPGYYSDVHDGNNEYTVQHNGIAVFTVIFDNNDFSQISIMLNNNFLTAESKMITSNGVNLENHIRYLTIPVFAGDVIKTGYYLNYGVKSIKMRLLYGS